MAPLAEQKLRGEYGARDVARMARRLGLPFAAASVPAGVSLACSRAFYALPDADAGIYVTLSVAITFPFNIVVGIPLYMWLAQAVAG